MSVTGLPSAARRFFSLGDLAARRDRGGERRVAGLRAVCAAKIASVPSPISLSTSPPCSWIAETIASE